MPYVPQYNILKKVSDIYKLVTLCAPVIITYQQNTIERERESFLACFTT